MENSTGSGAVSVLFGINSSVLDAALGESLASTFRIEPRSTICLKVSIAPMILVFPEAFGP